MGTFRLTNAGGRESSVQKIENNAALALQPAGAPSLLTEVILFVLNYLDFRIGTLAY